MVFAPAQTFVHIGNRWLFCYRFYADGFQFDIRSENSCLDGFRNSAVVLWIVLRSAWS